MRTGTIDINTSRGTSHLRVLVPVGRPEMENGLQGHEGKLSADVGMIFLPTMLAPSDREMCGTISMWLASVCVPLSILWFDGNGVLQHMETLQPGDEQGFSEEGAAVLELRADVAEDLHLEIGFTRATWSVDENAKAWKK